MVYVQVNGINIEKLTITDMTGRVVGEFNSEMAVKINVKDFNAGSYILNITTDQGSAQRKLIVQ